MSTATPTAPATSRTRAVWLLAVADGAAVSVAGFLVGRPTIMLPLAWCALLMLARGYESRPVRLGAQEVRSVFAAGLGLLAGTWLLIPLWGSAAAPELLLLCATAVGLSVLHRVTFQAVLGARGSPHARVLVVGRRRDVVHLVGELRRRPAHGFTVAAVCVPKSARGDGFDVPVTRGFARLAEVVEAHRVDAVIAVPGRQLDPARLRRLGWSLETTGAHLFVAPGLVDVVQSRATVVRAGSVPLLHVRPAEHAGLRRIVKECWERSAAAVALVLLLPVLLSLAILIRLDSPGPAWFRQVRIGRDDAPFTMYKLRTMTAGAESAVAELRHLNEAGGVLFKMREDPRVTRVGRILRKYSLDELPQLLNVALGQMSLVGPRPALPVEVEQYDHDMRRRLRVKPGLTGLWQVSGRSDLSAQDAVRLDLAYVDNWSLGLDLRIVASTFRAVMKHQGAY